jgi:hypothetical protein
MISEAPTELKQRIDAYIAMLAATHSRFDDGFPENFDSYLFFYHSFLQDPLLMEAVAQANAAVGYREFIYIPKQFIEGDPHPDLVVANDAWPDLTARIPWGLNFYLAAPDFQWLVWAYHEPCLHIGGPVPFIEAFKKGFPQWNAMESHWYDNVCWYCRAPWQPNWGHGDERPRWCPACRNG